MSPCCITKNRIWICPWCSWNSSSTRSICMHNANGMANLMHKNSYLIIRIIGVVGVYINTHTWISIWRWKFGITFPSITSKIMYIYQNNKWCIPWAGSIGRVIAEPKRCFAISECRIVFTYSRLQSSMPGSAFACRSLLKSVANIADIRASSFSQVLMISNCSSSERTDCSECQDKIMNIFHWRDPCVWVLLTK